MSENLSPEFELPSEQERKPINRYLEMTLAYNRRRDLREPRRPNLYGIGVDFYEEDRIRIEQELNW